MRKFELKDKDQIWDWWKHTNLRRAFPKLNTDKELSDFLLNDELTRVIEQDGKMVAFFYLAELLGNENVVVGRIFKFNPSDNNHEELNHAIDDFCREKNIGRVQYYEQVPRLVERVITPVIQAEEVHASFPEKDLKEEKDENNETISTETNAKPNRKSRRTKSKQSKQGLQPV